MKQAFQHIILILMAIILVTVAIQSVSPDPDELDDYSQTHQNTGHPTSELQHVHNFHFDNMACLYFNKHIGLGNLFYEIKLANRQDFPEFTYAALIWQPPRSYHNSLS